MISYMFATCFFALCLLAALRDLSSLIIPNWLNAWMAFLFLPACIVVMPGWETFGWHVLAGAIAFAIGVLLFMTGIVGGGDAKMIPAVMLWLGPNATMPFIYWMTLLGGALTILILIARKMTPAHAAPGFAYETLQEERGVPYGIAIAAGAVMASPASPLLTNFLS